VLERELLADDRELLSEEALLSDAL